MDKRLKLTQKQKKLVKQLQETFCELEKEKIGIVGDYSGGLLTDLCFYNKEEVLDSGCHDGNVKEDTYEEYDKEMLNDGITHIDKEVNANELMFYFPNINEMKKTRMPFYVTKEDDEAGTWALILKK